MSPAQIIAILAKEARIDNISEYFVQVISVPPSFSSSREIVEKEFREFIKKWDKILPDVEQEEGDVGIDSSGVIYVLAKDGWHLFSDFRNLQICTTCYSDEIFSLEWVNINTGRTDKKVSYGGASIDDVWCNNCKAITGKMSLSHIRKIGG